MKIGIFGGSFNPPHIMHKDIALSLINLGYVDKVIFVPTGDRYEKKDLVSFSHRYNMCNLMCKDIAKLEVSNFEENNKLVSTYQTLDYFSGLYKGDEIYFILGLDNLDELDTWKRYEYLISNFKFLVIRRDGNDLNATLKKYEKYLSSIIVTDVKMKHISSTNIRKSIRENLKSNSTASRLYDNILDYEVLEYIQNNSLYV